MAENLPSPSVLLADRSYDGGSNRAKLTARNVLHVIPMRTSRKKRIGVDRLPYCLRNLVECCFNKLKNARRVATLSFHLSDYLVGQRMECASRHGDSAPGFDPL